MGRHVNSFRDLEVYQLSRQLSLEIFRLSQKFPKEETYALTDQIRRASRSVGAQIAEAWAKRRYQRHFISKLTDADGEQQETQHWIETAMDCHYLNLKQGKQWLEQYASIGRMLNAMLIKADAFCSKDVSQNRSPITGHRLPVTDYLNLIAEGGHDL